jgi:hypothetical protein
MKDSTMNINKNIREILTTPNYLDTVKQTMAEIKAKLAAKKAAKFGFSENYNGGLDLFDDLTDDTINYNEFGSEMPNEFGSEMPNEFGSEMSNDMETETESNLGTVITDETESITGTEMTNETENDFGNETPISKMRVYDMNPQQRKEYMTNKFGAKFAHEFDAESYINSKGIPAVKYTRNNSIYNEPESNAGQPIISGFGEEEENLF